MKHWGLLEADFAAIYHLTPADIARMSWRRFRHLAGALHGRDDSVWARIQQPDTADTDDWQPPSGTTRTTVNSEKQSFAQLTAGVPRVERPVNL